MPPRARTPKRPAAEPEQRRPVKADAPICSTCWPKGWPEDRTNVGCGHGSYKR